MLLTCTGPRADLTPAQSTTDLLTIPSVSHRKRGAADNDLWIDASLSMYPATGRRRLHSQRDETDVFADVTMITNNKNALVRNLAVELAQQHKAQQDLEALLHMQIAIGDEVTASE